MAEYEKSSVYYFIPIKLKEELEGEVVSFDKNLVFKKSSAHMRNLVRSDVQTCINNIKYYRLNGSDVNKLSIDSYCFLKDEEGQKINSVALSNLSKIISISALSIFSFDKNNSFLVLHCFFKEELSEDGTYSYFDIEKAIRAHAHLVNNLFKENFRKARNYSGEIVADEKPATIVELDEPIDTSSDRVDGYVAITVNDKEYYFFRGENSFATIAGFSFEFKDYQVQHLSRVFLLEDDPEKRYSYAERLSSGTVRSFILNPEKNAYDTKMFTSMFSNFGAAVCAFKTEDLDLDKDKKEIESLNFYNRRLFLHELFYDFLIAINYRIRIKRQILSIGEINYDDNSHRQYEEIRAEIQKYSRESALYYYENVSQFDSVNEWYKLLLKGLDVNNLCDELEIKLKDADSYISYTAQLLKEKKEKRTSKIAYIFSAIVGTVLAIFSFLQVVYTINDLENRTIISIIGSILLVIAATIGCFIILRMNDKNKG